MRNRITNSLNQGTKLEIESVLRETCDRVLEAEGVPRYNAQLRAVALQILGQAYVDVRKDEDVAKEESEYVRIEPKNSRARTESQAGRGPRPS